MADETIREWRIGCSTVRVAVVPVTGLFISVQPGEVAQLLLLPRSGLKGSTESMDITPMIAGSSLSLRHEFVQVIVFR
jgi:hypothetical protein